MVRTRSQTVDEPLPVVGVKRKQRPTSTKKNTTKQTKKQSVSTTRATKTKATPKSTPKATPKPKKETRSSRNTISKALSIAEEKQKEKDAVVDKKLESEIKTTRVSSKLKNVNKDLIQNVRRRELQNKLDIENCTKEKLHTKSLLQRMPEVCRHIRAFYRQQKKSVMELATIIQQLCELTSPPIPKNEIADIINLLVDIVDGWCTIITINETEYLKVDMKAPFNDVKKKILSKIEEIDTNSV